MLRDITIGQYFPGHSVIHRLDSRMKILLTSAILYCFLLWITLSGTFFPVRFCSFAI